jgi:FKBP-type peptidyl-prolyl cis-trans isomerase FkpA
MIKTVSRYVILCICLAALLSCSRLSSSAGSAAPKLETEDQKTLYTMGLLLGRDVKPLSLTPEEMEFVKAGLADAAADVKPQVELETYGPKVNAFAQKRASSKAEGEKKKGQEFAEKVAKESGAVKTPSGIVIRTINAGSGASPTAEDIVKVHYEGKLIDNTIFDSSIARKEPAEFGLKGVVPCWTEALQTMKKGGKAQVVCPSDLAYGDGGQPPTDSAGSHAEFRG